MYVHLMENIQRKGSGESGLLSLTQRSVAKFG